MTPKEEQILRMLREGKSYSSIQTMLQVSPSKIAMVKKAFMASDNDLNRSSSGTIDTTISTTTGSQSRQDSSKISSDIVSNSFNNFKTYDKMETNRFFDESGLDSSDRMELEKLRLEQSHEIALRKLEQDDEALDLKRRELSLKEKQVVNEKAKVEKQGKILLARFRKLAEKCKDGRWSYDRAVDSYNDAVALQDEIEIYCLENDIETSGLTVFTIIERIIEEFDHLTEEVLDEGDSEEIEFDDDIPDLIIEAKTAVWDTYD